MQKICTVSVNNVSSDAEKYIVARLVEGVLWYYTSWKTKEEAQRQADTSEDFVVVEG